MGAMRWNLPAKIDVWISEYPESIGTPNKTIMTFVDFIKDFPATTLPFSNTSLGVFLGGCSLLGLGIAITYRLYLSPIAKFPGPKLAALTFLYEFYYDVWQEGKYTWKIRDLHDKYGV